MTITEKDSIPVYECDTCGKTLEVEDQRTLTENDWKPMFDGHHFCPNCLDIIDEFIEYDFEEMTASMYDRVRRFIKLSLESQGIYQI